MTLNMHYFRHYMGDHARLARHFSMLEEGAYLRLASAYFSRMQPLPLDITAVYRLVMANTDAERDAVNAVLQDLFEKSSDCWRNSSFDKQLAEYRANFDQARSAANARWERHRQRTEMQPDEKGSPPAMRTHSASIANQEPVTSIQEPITTVPQPEAEGEVGPLKSEGRKRLDYPSGFLSFWDKYPRKVGKLAAANAWKFASKLDEASKIENAASKFAALCRRKATPIDKIPHPATWLNAGRWEDEEPAEIDLPVWERPGNRMSFPKPPPEYVPNEKKGSTKRE